MPRLSLISTMAELLPRGGLVAFKRRSLANENLFAFALHGKNCESRSRYDCASISLQMPGGVFVLKQCGGRIQC